MINSLRYPLAWLFLVGFGIGVAAGGGLDNGAGNYGGVISSPGIAPGKSGLLQLQLTSTGAISGVLIWEGQRYPFTGSIKEGQTFERTFTKKLPSVLPADLHLILSLSISSRFIAGDLVEREGANVLTLPVGLSGAPPDPVLVEKLRPGLRISFIDPPNPTTEGEEPVATVSELGPAVAEIPGDGFVHVRISKSKKRASRMVGRLPDARGTFTAGSPLRGTNYTVYHSLYKKLRLQGGQIFGDAIVIDNGSEPPKFTSTLRWGKDAEAGAVYYPSPFDLPLSIEAVPYPKLRRGDLVPLLPGNSALTVAPLGITEPIQSINARILFRRGNISVSDGMGGFNRYFKQNIKMNPFHTQVVGDNPHHVKIQVDAFSGRFHGSFIHPRLDAKTRFRGAFQAAVLLTPGQGRGHFRPPSGPGIIPLMEPMESGGVRINVQ